MNSWIAEKDLMEQHCLTKKAFYSVLYLKNVPEEDYIHAQNIFKEFEIKKLG